MAEIEGFTTTPGLDGARVRAKDESDPRWGTAGVCFGMLGSDYVLVMFDEFEGYVAAVPVAEFAQHYFLRPQMSDAWCDQTYREATSPDVSQPVGPEERERQQLRHQQVAGSLGFRSNVRENSTTPFRHSQR